MNSLDDFIKASLEAIKELYHIVEESSADKDLYKKYSIGHGGDISYGIDLIAESINLTGGPKGSMSMKSNFF